MHTTAAQVPRKHLKHVPSSLNSVVMMDEPTSGLDARSAAVVMRVIRNIGASGRTVIGTCMLCLTMGAHV
jgi:ABC-type transporter Mla maintaining outer membrane lipid asymmetry ATPase subunit MlaF